MERRHNLLASPLGWNRGLPSALEPSPEKHTMENINKILWAVGTVCVSLIIVGYFHLGAVKQEVSQSLGTVAAGFTNLTSLSLTGILEFVNGPGQQNQTGIQLDGSVTTCNTATTTLFSVMNPFLATTTATVWMSMTGQATTSSLYVGTTTVPAVFTASKMSSSLIASSTVTANTPAYVISGMSTNLGTGQVAAYDTTYGGPIVTTRIVVGPSEYVLGFATSTYTGVGSLNYVGGLTSCTYKILWQY